VNINSNTLVNNEEKDDEPFSNEEPLCPQSKYPARYVQKHHLIDQIVGDFNTGV